MTAAAAALVAVPGALLATLSLYLLALSLAGAATRHAPKRRAGSPSTRIAVLVPAHNEGELIERCVRSLLGQTYPRELYRVVVIADNCSDSTVERAAAAGAEVLVRDEPASPGKGQALRWAADLLLAGPDAPDALVVVDGDSVADSNLVSALEAEFRAGHEVVQADYSMLTDETSSPRVQLIAAGFLLFHRVRFAGRAALGMPANLVGNGMLFGRTTLLQHPWSAFTGVEDLEYSIELRLAGVRPRFARDGHVAGPGPVSRRGELNQRMRWEGGRFHVMRTRLPILVWTAVRTRQPGLMDAALDLATPPLGLLANLLFAGLLVSVAAFAAHLAPLWAVLPWVTGLLAVALFVVIGLLAARAPAAMWRSLAGAPLFLAWKVVTYTRLARGFDVNRWDRTERAHEAQDERVFVSGVPVDSLDMSHAVAKAGAAIESGRLLHIATVNLDFVVRAQQNADVRRILQGTGMNLADGWPVVWLARRLGSPIRGRVAGADFVPALLQAQAANGARVFLLGGENGVAISAALRISELYPGLVVAGTYEPPRAPVEQMMSDEILTAIAQSRADILLVALGHPKQERWIHMHRDQLQVSVAVGVGCVLDLLADRVKRAPRWMQVCGLEWAFRLLQEPDRLFSRYVADVAWLVPIAFAAMRSRRSAGVRSAEAV